MQVMVINDDPEVQVRVAKGLMSKGFQVVGMETVARACAYVKIDPVDILITGERVGGRLSHTVALAAECANPMVTTMLLTDRNDPEIEELYDLLPSLYALISPKSDPAVVARLALSAVASPEDAERRMRRNAEARQTQPMADWAAVFQDNPLRHAPVQAAIDGDATDWETKDWETMDGEGEDWQAEADTIVLAAPEPAAFAAVPAPPRPGDRLWSFDAPPEAEPAEQTRVRDNLADPAAPSRTATGKPAVAAVPPGAGLSDADIVVWDNGDASGSVATSDLDQPAVTEPAAEAIWHVDPAPAEPNFDHAFADLMRDERRIEALRIAAHGASPETAVPRNPLFAPGGQSAMQGAPLPAVRPRPVNKPGPLPPVQPEVVPTRQSRSDWIAAKVRELEGEGGEGRARLHLA